MKINYRIASSKNVGKWADIMYDNKDKIYCDLCGAKLWIDPNGRLYCNNEHTEKELKGLKTKKIIS